MPMYMYHARLYSESIAAMIKEPQDRIERAAQPVVSDRSKLLAAGYAFGDYESPCITRRTDDQGRCIAALAIGAGGV